MLDGRDDPQPVGYLWLEFERDGRYLACGCGIKANRSSDNVTTWWFITERRPAIDLHLVEGGTALSADALRGLVEEFVTRDGTDYGVRERTVEEKCRDVMRQLERGEVKIVFDPASRSANLVTSRAR